jgi:DNA-binding transcriptional MerR regulator
MIKITLTKDMLGKDLIKEFENTYGSIKDLKEIFEKDPENMKLYTDLDEWEYFLKHPEENIQKKHVKFTEDVNLSKLDLKLLSMIKSEDPESINDLADKLRKDKKNIKNKMNHLAKEGLVYFEKRLNDEKPVLIYDKIEIAI